MQPVPSIFKKLDHLLCSPEAAENLLNHSAGAPANQFLRSKRPIDCAHTKTYTYSIAAYLLREVLTVYKGQQQLR